MVCGDVEHQGTSTRADLFREGVETIIANKRKQTTLSSWFRWQELKMAVRDELASEGSDPDSPMCQAEILVRCVMRMELTIPEGSVLAGTQDDAFSPSYALINPSFKVESFAGYCDPVAIYDDMAATEEYPQERIESMKARVRETRYVRSLEQVYAHAGPELRELVYFVEPVTGHIVPDVRPFLSKGIAGVRAGIQASASTDYSRCLVRVLDAVTILAGRYAELADTCRAERTTRGEEARLGIIKASCQRIAAGEAPETLHEAIQMYTLVWMVMVLEQSPNPYAFSVGNLDRILQPWLKSTERAEAVALVRAFLAFLMVGNRCWAISQNVMVGGRDLAGKDLTCEMTGIVLAAFFESNNPQPALSVKLHRGTPESVYTALENFFFTPGHSTPSLFNDDMVFTVLERKGIASADIPDYGIAGCQEPVIMGRENANTTNSWLNLGKILEITLNNGCAILTGHKLGLSTEELGYDNQKDLYNDLENAFLKQLDYVLPRMARSANACTDTLAQVAVPMTSVLLHAEETGRDARDCHEPGVRYQASGCLIHGLAVVADSLEAVASALKNAMATAEEINSALVADFAGCDELYQYLLRQDKFGCRIEGVDYRASRLAKMISERVGALRNTAGHGFLPDFSTPSTHLLYGWHVSATPDGRRSRTMLNYGIDSLPGRSPSLEDRIISQQKLPFDEFTGGYASHIGLSPDEFLCPGENRMSSLVKRVIKPLFRFQESFTGSEPYYVYFNIDSADKLRLVLSDPKKYAPDGIYIMRIHGTFVNFLDLSPAIQKDIISRLENRLSSKI
ncbi:MAG: pyruvate formate lyase family protein [Planctomycetia bacterium]|nr:pyruvate formate lyase family protein [Planctomycetia bacterium]